MAEQKINLGKLVSIHGTSPVFLQRAAIIAVLSFFFFLAMLAAFYIRQQLGYFVISSAFLFVYIFTLVGWLRQKRNIIRIYENGLRYKNFLARWDEITAEVVNNGKEGKPTLNLINAGGEKITVPSTIHNIEDIKNLIEAHIS